MFQAIIKLVFYICCFCIPLGQSADDDWKEESFRKQQEILRKRRENGGFISEEETAEIQKRRLEVSSEERMLREVQQGKEGADGLDKWKQLRDEGKIKTASSGLVRDEDSSRLGSEGLFAERIDAKLPYIDSGYVPEGEEEKDGGDFFGGLAKMFGKK